MFLASVGRSFSASAMRVVVPLTVDLHRVESAVSMNVTPVDGREDGGDAVRSGRPSIDSGIPQADGTDGDIPIRRLCIGPSIRSPRRRACAGTMVEDASTIPA